MELWAGGYNDKDLADRVAEMLKKSGVEATVVPSERYYGYDAWDVQVKGTRAEAQAKLAGKKAEIPPDALGLNWGTLTKIELWKKAKDLGITDEIPPYAKATKKEILEAIELKEKE